MTLRLLFESGILNQDPLTAREATTAARVCRASVFIADAFQCRPGMKLEPNSTDSKLLEFIAVIVIVFAVVAMAVAISVATVTVIQNT